MNQTVHEGRRVLRAPYEYLNRRNRNGLKSGNDELVMSINQGLLGIFEHTVGVKHRKVLLNEDDHGQTQDLCITPGETVV